MIKHVQVGSLTLNRYWPGHSCATFGCLSRARGMKQQLEKWLETKDIQLSKGAIEVFVKLSNGDESPLSNSPQGECELLGCCGNVDKILWLSAR